ncbi:MAG: DUF2182 domain-containing protein [Xanthomonadales bacterium]|nr:DUF2182 domain-containing protein [Xanthomonadales bacterium]
MTLLERDRLLVAVSLVVVSLLSWAWMFAGAGMGMSGLEMTRHSLMGMDMMGAPEWTVSHALVMFAMWWIMMIAMMLPSASPVVLLATALNRRAAPGRKPFGPAAAFTLGYLLAWALFSGLAVVAQWLMQSAELVDGMLRSRSTAINATLLLLAGSWQFTPWKHACLRHCRGPLAFLTRRSGQGKLGAVRTGIEHGLYCLGCCWFLMVLLFVGGVMNLLWIAGIAAYVWVEKLLPGGLVISRVMGALLITWGTAILLLP